MNQSNSNFSPPLVTAIIPAYNQEKYIEATIQSVHAQNYSNLEVIVTNDCSTDRTTQIVNDLKSRYGYTLIDNQTNLGLTRTLNLALSRANGTYVALIGGDDFWLPEKTAIQVDYMEKHLDVVASSGRVLNMNSNGDIYESKAKGRINDLHTWSFDDFFMQNYYFPAIASMIRTSILRKVGGFDERYRFEDLPLWLKLAWNGYRIDILPQDMAIYRIHSAGLHKNRQVMFDSHLQLIKDYVDYPNYPRAVRDVYSKQLKHGNTMGWRHFMVCMVRGFRFQPTYFRNLAKGLYSSLRQPAA